MTFLFEFFYILHLALPAFQTPQTYIFKGDLSAKGQATAETEKCTKKRKKKSATKMWAGALKCCSAKDKFKSSAEGYRTGVNSTNILRTSSFLVQKCFMDLHGHPQGGLLPPSPGQVK